MSINSKRKFYFYLLYLNTGRGPTLWLWLFKEISIISHAWSLFSGFMLLLFSYFYIVTLDISKTLLLQQLWAPPSPSRSSHSGGERADTSGPTPTWRGRPGPGCNNRFGMVKCRMVQLHNKLITRREATADVMSLFNGRLCNCKWKNLACTIQRRVLEILLSVWSPFCPMICTFLIH